MSQKMTDEADRVNNDRGKFFHPDAEKESKNSPAIDKFQIFEDWLAANRVRLPKLELRDYGSEVRGCHAKVDIKDDEIIIEVPLKCLITVEMGKETEIGRKILSSNIELDAPKHIFLMVFMLVDRARPDSFFKPYYDILPKTLSNMPIFWSTEELRYLEGSYLIEQIDERNDAIQADYLAICNIAPEFADIASLQDFKWARMCVCSRNFGLVVNGMQTAAMVPYADMLNHYRPRETKWQFDDSLQSFTVVSLQELTQGVQVYDSYGRKCNHRFLLNYGFSVENNVEIDGFCPNEVPLLLELSKSDPLLDAKCAFYRRDLSVPQRRIRVCVSDNDNTKTMMAMLRIIVADQDDFDLLISCSSNSLYRSIRDAQVAISVKNESAAMRLLAELCAAHLAKYPSTFEQDSARLAQQGGAASGSLAPFSNERHALIQVKGEKEVLLFFQDFANTATTMLQSRSLGQFDQLLDTVRSSKHPVIYHYCLNTLNRLLQDEYRRMEIRQRRVDLSRPTVV